MRAIRWIGLESDLHQLHPELHIMPQPRPDSVCVALPRCPASDSTVKNKYKERMLNKKKSKKDFFSQFYKN